MKTNYFCIFLLLLTLSIGSLSLAHGSVSLDRTTYPVPDVDPLELWSMHDIIIDGVVLDKKSILDENGKEIFGYNIKVNDYFKGKQNAKIIYAKQLHVFPNFHLEKDDNALFYIVNTSEFGYVIQSHSVKTFGDCDARSLIEIIPVLPNEKSPHSTPTRSESYFDPCIADYFSHDPDFFKGIHNGISPFKQTQFNIPIEKIRCYGDLVLIQKHDDSPACVTPETKTKLIERRWSADFENDLELKPELRTISKNEILSKGIGLDLPEDTFTQEDLKQLQQKEKELNKIANNSETLEEKRRQIHLEIQEMQVRLQYPFQTGVPYHLILFMQEKYQIFQEHHSELKDEISVTHSSPTDISHVHHALRIGIHPDSFTLSELESQDKKIRKYLGDEMNILYEPMLIVALEK